MVTEKGSDLSKMGWAFAVDFAADFTAFVCARNGFYDIRLYLQPFYDIRLCEDEGQKRNGDSGRGFVRSSRRKVLGTGG